MGRPKKSAPAHVEPEDESQEAPDEEPAALIEPEPVAAQPSMSKADACRAALAAGIVDAEKAREFTRSKFGIEIKATDFTLYKSKAKQASDAAPAKRGRKPKEAESVAARPAATPKATPTANGQPDLLAAMEAMKPLIASLGKEQAHRIIDLLG